MGSEVRVTTFAWQRYAADPPVDTGPRISWSVVGVGLLLIAVFVYLKLYWLSVVGVVLPLLGVPLVARNRTKVTVVGDEVVLHPQHIYANVYPWLTCCFGLFFMGTAVQMSISGVLDIRILFASVLSGGLAVFFGLCSFMTRGPVRISASQVRLPGRKPMKWEDSFIGYDPPGRSAGAIAVHLKNNPKPHRLRMFDYLRFGTSAYNLDFNTVVSTLAQLRTWQREGITPSPDQIRAMLLTPAPDPLPAVGKSVEVPIDVRR
ncbi:hypothetical protein [Gordonia jinhuaensis]|uniref:Uncharacterized protein n=1 Tax=Gordonia jinhuaensis TaxID=1517702 RepID=A0A916WXA1_9ACTN|nr:hypothetical protein [Gordonia jinhuaensis]GGB36974.1 hypothetical protein GCM10011489_26040 [Gordonia jinhuaensis]